MTTETEKRIAELQEVAAREWQASLAACARHYDAEAEVARLRGDTLDAEFNASLAASYRREDGADDRKQRAYVRLVASRHVHEPVPDLSNIDPKDHAAVLAEVARLKAEAEDPAAELLAPRPSHETTDERAEGLDADS